jgi:hypothetical protein
MGSLVVLERPADPQKVMATLSELMETAKAGEVECFVAVAMRPDGTFFTLHSGCENLLTLIGALHCAQHDLTVVSDR